MAFIVLSLLQKNRLNSEYEYIHSNEHFTVLKIVNNGSRKCVFVAETNKMLVIAKQGSDALRKYDYLKKKDFTGGNSDDTVYEIICNTGQGQMRIAVCMTEKMLAGLKTWSHSAVM